MVLNIDDIKTKSKKCVILTEIRDFVVIFSIILVFGWLFINAQLIVILFDDIFNTSVSAENEITIAKPENKVVIKEVLVEKNTNGDDLNVLKSKILSDNLDSKLNSLKVQSVKSSLYKPDYDSVLKNNLSKYDMVFNTLPPDSRLTIPKIGVDVTVQQLTNVPVKTIKDADYDEYLYHGVVQYPYTPDPGTKGNVLIFGHTSYYWWKKNPYGTVFANIPKLRHGDVMKLTWEGKEYEYKIIKKLILRPSQVPANYKKYNDGEYLTIMGCYPIGSDRQRMLVIAQRQ